MDSGERVADYFVAAGYETGAELLKVTDETEANAKENIKDPVTDLTVINRSAGERVPEGFTCIETTPAGNIANLNYGSFRSPELFLCLRRGRDKPPLIHIGVLFEGRDRLLPNCEILRETPDGRCANVNNTNSSRTFITYKRASPRSSPNELVVTDVCVVIKDEKAPHTYWKIGDRNLNNALMGSDVFLCYKKATVNISYITYQPSLLFRYPEKDYPSLPLPVDVQLFTMPMGASLEAWPKEAESPRPTFAKFVLTVSDKRSQVYNGGKAVQKMYGAALTFYESYPREKLTEDQVAELTRSYGDREITFYANKSICILSKWPFYDAFQSFLQHLLVMSFSTVAHALPIERVIGHLIREIPFPSVHRPKVLVQLNGSTAPIPLIRPGDSPLPLNGASFTTMLKNMSPENCVNAFLLALSEQKICLHSLRPDVLTAVAESVTSMIFPFVWQCPYVPLCPLGLCGLLHAPVPFIVGVDSRYFDLYDPPLDVIYVDLDTNSIQMPPDRLDLLGKMMPKKPAKLLMEKLDKINAKMHKDAARSVTERKKVPGAELDAIPGEKEFKQRVKTRQFDAEIQEVFLSFMVSILRGYRNYLKPMTRMQTENATDPGSLFDFPGFLKSRERSCAKFFDGVVHTQQFIRFIEERTIMSDRDASYGMAFFDQCVGRVEKEGLNDKALIDTEDILGERTVFIPPPEADKAAEKFLYGKAFPVLCQELFEDAPSWVPKDTPERSDREASKSILSAGDSVTSRTKQEIKSSQNVAQLVHPRSKLWAKYLLSTGYAIWFMCLPSFVAASHSPSRTLKNAFETLRRMVSAKIQPADEVCYRIVMQLCGQYNQPALAVRVLFEMKNHHILPDAVTYGYYNKVVFESTWPAMSHAPDMLWTKLRLVLRGATQFKQAGIRRMERNRDKLDGVDSLSSIPHLLMDGLSVNDDKKPSNRGSSDTGFFSLDSEGKRNSMLSLASGEFLASIAELKPKTETQLSSSSDTGDQDETVTITASVSDKAVISPTRSEALPLEPSSIVRRSGGKLRLPSVGRVSGMDFCSAGVLMVSHKLEDKIKRTPSKSTERKHRRHRSLTEDPRQPTSPRKKRHFSTSGLSLSPRNRGDHGFSSIGPRTSLKTTPPSPKHTRPPVLGKLPLPALHASNETVVVLEESVHSVEIPSPVSEFDSEDGDVVEPPRRHNKSLSVPYEGDAVTGSVDSLPRMSVSSSTDFVTSAVKLGGFIRNSKSYSSIKKFWSPRKSKDLDAASGDFSLVDASPLTKTGTALVSGMKTMTFVLGKKLGELSNTLTSASSDAGSPSHGSSSLRDLPGALNFTDYGYDTYGSPMEAPEWNEEEEETYDEKVDGMNHSKSWEFPSYSVSPRHSTKAEGHDGLVIAHVDMASLVVCQRCHTVIYDEEILAGYWPDESNLNARCPYCATKFLPELTVVVYDHTDDDQETKDDGSVTTVSSSCPFLRNSGKSMSNLSVSTADKRSSTISTSQENVEQQQQASSETSVVEDVLSLSNGNPSSPPKAAEIEVVVEDASSSQTSSICGRLCSCQTRERLKVPYLSPLVLRKELETLIANEGNACLMASDLDKSHAIVYWNLLWYCERLGLPQSLGGILIDERGTKTLQELSHSINLTSKSRFVVVSCRWDDPLLHAELGIPMYLAYAQTGSISSQLNALGIEDSSTWIAKNAMVEMLIRIRDHSDLLKPMKSFLHHVQKRSDPHHRSLYRELLFLAIRALDSENIDRLAFDKVYKNAFQELRKNEDFIGILQADDRPPSLSAGWCRQAFRPLDL